MFFLVTLYSALASVGSCELPIARVIFESQLSDIEDAMLSRNLPQMSQQMEELELQVPCLTQPLSPDIAARYHLVNGIRHWLDQENTTAKIYFSAAKAASSDVVIATEVFPLGHQIHKTFDGAPLIEEQQPISQAGDVYFDGELTLNRPLFQPTLFQIGRGDQIVLSQVLLPTDAIPHIPPSLLAELYPEEVATGVEGAAVAGATEAVEVVDNAEEAVSESELGRIRVAVAEKPRSQKLVLMSSAAITGTFFLILNSSSHQFAELPSDAAKLQELSSEKEINGLRTRNQIGLWGGVGMSTVTLWLAFNLMR